MFPRQIDSLKTVEAVMALEEALGMDIPDVPPANFDSSREFVDWLELRLSNQRPNERAAGLLEYLAKAHHNSELMEGLNGTWRRAQLAAIIREMFPD